MFKTNSEIIRIEALSQAEIKTGVTFWSHDKGTAKLIFKLFKDGVPQSIPEGTRVPIRLNFRSETAEDGIGKHDYLATIDDRVNGIVSIVLQDNILGYVGEVKGSIYMDFPDNRSLDTAGRFNFSIRRSPIDDVTPELEDYYFNGFNEVIETIESIVGDTEKRIDEKQKQIEDELKAKIDEVEVKVNTFDERLTQAQESFDRIEEDLKQAGSLKKLYSNSIDFGNYDYSGNPNLLPPIDHKNFLNGTGATVSTNQDGEIVFVLDGNDQLNRHNTAIRLPAVTEGKTYTISAEIMFHNNLVGNPSNIRLSLNYLLSGWTCLETTRPIQDVSKGKWIKLTGTKVVKYGDVGPQQWYLNLLDVTQSNRMTGTISIRKIKIEEGSQATPYQPNLLMDPWNISENIPNPDFSDPTKTFPISNSNYVVYDGRRTEKWEVGKTYTVSMKATKPSSQRFDLYLGAGTVRIGSFSSVDGKVDEWKITFTLTQSNIDAGAIDILRVYQFPSTSLGSCNISWLKLEEGPNATPLIKEYKYQGLGQTKFSIDKYLWKPFQIKNEFYSNDINFGDYDYSGNPNLAVTSPETFSSGTGGQVSYENDEWTVLMDGSGRLSKYNVNSRYSTPLKDKTQYTMSAEIYVGSDYTGDVTQIFANYAYTDGGYGVLQTARLKSDSPRDTWIKIKGSSVVDFQDRKPKVFYFTWQTVANATNPTGTLKIRKIKIEEGSEATPYQPNLISDPYRLCRGPISKNLANKDQSFPISTRDYLVYNADMEKDFEAGKTYTVTLKGSKSNVQEFRVYITGQETLSRIGDMSPVIGLADTWSLTFTALPSNLNGSSSPKNLRIYQFPQTTAGAVTIEDLKIEENDRFTQNTSNYKYRGVNNFVSKNPKDYTWDISPDYLKLSLEDTVSLTKPQSILGSKNFLDQPYINNNRVATEHFGVMLTGGMLQGVPLAEGTALKWGNVHSVDNERSKINDLFTISSDNKTLTILRDCSLQISGKFTCQTDNGSYYAYLDFLVNGGSKARAAGIAGNLNWRNDVGFIFARKHKAGDVLTIMAGTNYTTSSVNAWGVDQLYIKELVPV